MLNDARCTPKIKSRMANVAFKKKKTFSSQANLA